MENQRWTKRLHTTERDARQASELTTQSLARLLDESLRLDATEYPPLRAVSAS